MNLDLKLSTAAIKASLVQVLRRFHVVIFFLIVLGSTGGFVLLLGQVMQTSSDTSGYVSPNSNTTFDKKTIERIKTLGDSKFDDTIIDSRRAQNIRVDPFVE